jgi:hypothetical protein
VGLTAALVEGAHIHYLAASVVSVVVCSLLNFVVSDRMVFASVVGMTAAFATAGTTTVHATDLPPDANRVFDRYARLTEARMDQEQRGTIPFLWMNQLEEPQRRSVRGMLSEGQVVVRERVTREGDRLLRFSNVICHHWQGSIFVPGARLGQVAALMQAYDDYQNIYRPAVRRSKTLTRDGNHFTVYLQLFQKKVISVVLNTESDVTYIPVTSTRLQVRSRSTRITEVRQPDSPDEREAPPGHDRGFLWRFNNYCAIEQADEGTYVQCESVSLTRDIPFGLGWLIDPFVTAVPRESLEFTLRSIRTALVHH